MFSKVLVVLALSAIAACGDAPAVKSSIVLPQERFDSLKTNLQGYHTQEFASDLNGIVDEVLEQVQEILIQHGLDPTKLDDVHEGFEFQILIIKYHGELDLTDGWLQDLSTLHRIGDVSLTLQGSGKVVTLSIPVGFDDLMFTYLYSAKLMDLGPTGGLDGKVKDIEINLVVDYDLETNRLSLNSFKITKSGSISLKFSGNILTDWMVNLFTGVVTGILHNLILAIASAVVSNNLEEVIEQINDVINGGGFASNALPYN